MNDDCSCVYVDVDESYDDIVEKVITFTEDKICCECNEVIKAGAKLQADECYYSNEDYYSEEQEYELDKIYLTCLPCAGIRRDYFCDGWHYEMIWHDLILCFEDELTEEEFNAMVPKELINNF